MKKNILLVLITAIICIVGTASAAYVYTARDIGYTPQDENWEVTNASEALSSLKDDIELVKRNNVVNTRYNPETNKLEYKDNDSSTWYSLGSDIQPFEANKSFSAAQFPASGSKNELLFDTYPDFTRCSDGYALVVPGTYTIYASVAPESQTFSKKANIALSVDGTIVKTAYSENSLSASSFTVDIVVTDTVKKIKFLVYASDNQYGYGKFVTSVTYNKG